MPETLASLTIVPTFESPDELQAGLDAKSRFEAVDLYPRDGSVLLSDVESHLSMLARSDSELTLAYASGMAAVTAAIDVALLQAQKKRGDLPVLACAFETYSQTRRYFTNFLANKRAKIVYFDSADFDDVEKVITERKPDVIVSETIGNYLHVPVLDTERLLEAARRSPDPPAVVLDNTLPLSTALPLGEQLLADDRVIVVESGTKTYTRNQALLGIVYTANAEVHDYLRCYRRTRGDLPIGKHLEQIAECLSPSLEHFDDRNRRLFKQTGKIALSLAEGLEGDVRYTITHPALPEHDNHQLYNELYPDGGSPILHILSYDIPQLEIVKKLWRHPVVREQAHLGQSFGFDHARIVHDEHVKMVRLAGGAFTDGQALGEACAEALRGY